MSSSNILAFDTATKVCTVALRRSDGIVTERWDQGQGIHSEKLFLFVRELLDLSGLQMSEVETLLFTTGPGSYTGLRIGTSAMKGFAFGNDLEVYGINTLAFFAESARLAGGKIERVHAVIDARRSHLYHQLYSISDTDIIPETEVSVREIASLESIIKEGDVIIGTGIKRLPDVLKEKLHVFDTQNIKAVALISLFDRYANIGEDDVLHAVIKKVAPEQFEPYYYGPSIPQVNHGNLGN